MPMGKPRTLKKTKTDTKANTKANTKAKAKTSRPPAAGRMRRKVVLLSGDNPQIPKGEGDVPVQAYIAAIPGWKQALARRLDSLIERAVPRVRKAVKWNSPFYGAPGDEGWFAALHCFTHYIKVTFFRGRSLQPIPPGSSKHPEVRYLDVREGKLDEAQFIDWIVQASQLPGEKS